MKRFFYTTIALLCTLVVAGGIYQLQRDGNTSRDGEATSPLSSQASSGVAKPIEAEPAVVVQSEGGARGDGVIWGRIVSDDSNSDPKTLKVRCVLHQLGGQHVFPERVPDENGRFSCEALPWGRYTVKATSENGVAYETVDLSSTQGVREVSLTLSQGHPFAGVVMARGRVPLEGARVAVSEWKATGSNAQTFPTAGSEYLVATTDSQGSFRIEEVPSGIAEAKRQYRLLATADGYPGTPSAYYLPGTKNIEIVLGEGGDASGVVVWDESGDPVSGVAIQTRVAGTVLEVLSDAQGDFQFSQLAAGSYEAVVIDAERVSVESVYPFEVGEGQASRVPDIRIREGARIIGRVTEHGSGRGVGGATLRVTAQEGVARELRAPREVESGSDGGYVITGLPGGTYRVLVSGPPGYFIREPFQVHGQQTVALMVGRGYEGVNFTLSKGIVVAGRVHDPKGVPISGAEVTAIAETTENISVAETDGEGVFSVTLPVDGGRMELHAQKAGYLGEPLFLDSDVLSDTTEIELVLSPASTIAGTVVDSLENPRAGATVSLASVEEEKLTTIRTVTTERDGTFLYDFLEAGDYALQSGLFDRSAEGALEGPGVLQITLAEGESIQGLRLVLGEDGESISGRVTDQAGKPFQYAAISAWARAGMPRVGYAHSDEGGFYSVPGLPAGEYIMAAQAPRVSADRKRGVAAGSTGVDFVMVEPGVIAGQVLDASTRAPVTTFSFAVRHADEPRVVHHLKFRQVQDPEGRFRVEEAGVGENTIFFRAPDHMDADFTVTQVLSGQTTAEQIFTLEPGLTIQGTVSSPDGEALAGVRVLAEVGTSPFYKVSDARAVTDRNGHFVIRKLEDATYTVVAIHPEFTSAKVQAHPSSDRSVNIVLGNGGVVEGSVSVAGVPKADASVSVTSGDQVNKSTRTDARGEFRLAGVLPGTALVRVQTGVHSSPEYRKQERNVEVREGQSTEVHVDFPEANAYLQGTVYGLDSNPVAADVVLRVHTEDGVERKGQACGEDGFFFFDKVPTGEGELTVSFTGLIQRRVTVSIPEGAQVTQDIFLDSGYSIRCNVQAPSEPFDQIRLMAVPGEHFLSRADSDILNALLTAAISMSDSYTGGSVVLSGMVPGDYTVVAWVNTTAYREAQDPAERARLKLERPIRVVPVVLSGDNANPEIQIEF